MFRIKRWALVGCAAICVASSALAQRKTDLVDLFIGTSGDHGQLDPAACVPYGMARVCPDTRPRSHSGYDYAVTTISGFSVNRLSGIGCGGNGGHFSIKPALKDSVLQLLKATEKARPGYYAVTLSNGIAAELTAGNNVAVEKFLYPKGTEMFFSLNAASSFTSVRDASAQVMSDREISGYIVAGTTCNAGTYKLFFHLVASQSFTLLSHDKNKLELSFGKSTGAPVEVRIALSAIDEEAAAMENKALARKSFGRIRQAAAAEWEKMLGRVDIKGGSPSDRTLFYTSLYRVFLSPANTTSRNGKFLATNGTVQHVEGFTYYSSWSMWDNYRTKFPLITLLDPERMSDFCQSLLKLYEFGKKNWATPFESTPTVRTEHTIAVLLDAYRKGIKGINFDAVYTAIKSEVDSLRAERPDQAFETCIDLWALSNIAGETGRREDERNYGRRAKELFTVTWDKDFKNIDSTFGNMRKSGLYQGTRWQYRWAVPQYLDVMTAGSGGNSTIMKQLDYFFSASLNNQGAEAGIHAPFIFNRLGYPELSQKIVTRMLTEEMKHIYGGNAEYPTPITSRIFKNDVQGFLPEMDEDDGTMCGWYVFAATGLFPLVVGEPVYEITSPLFDEIRIHLANGKTFRIKTYNRQTADAIIRTAKWNGNELTAYSIDHGQLVKGGTLELYY
ncbi:glycoside hydrolase domain-containing protein [Chitinophaga rhizosphaerae]|uniref:glycoside hydrolase domain-containing protein n=1 Tax=Chitinophaga rhizosphaerae TaxID=1864947 RepID=UPI000F809CF5|nr:glycoside hydrolase domain-containing protein [Chitinophaga rhizosphaerae]